MIEGFDAAKTLAQYTDTEAAIWLWSSDGSPGKKVVTEDLRTALARVKADPGCVINVHIHAAGGDIILEGDDLREIVDLI